MGIKNLLELFRDDDGLEKTLPQNKLCGKIIAIDTNYIIARAFLSGVSLSDSSGNPTQHISTIYNNILELKNLGSFPLFIFDTKSPIEKKEEQDKRAARNLNIDFQKKIKEIILLLNAFNLPYYFSKNT